MFEALVAAEQRAKDGGIRQQYITGAIGIRRHPKKHVELPIARIGKRVGPGHVDRLFGKYTNGFCVFAGWRVVREMHVEVESGHALEPAFGIQIFCNC